MASNVFKHLLSFSNRICLQNVSNIKNIRLISTTNRTCFDAVPDRKHQLSIMDHYFEREKSKTKEKFIELVDVFEKRNFRTGHVEFVYCAMKRMYDYGLQEDLEVYKKIINVMPKGKLIAENIMQSEWLHFPKHQMAITDLLTQMEENGKINTICFSIVEFFVLHVLPFQMSYQIEICMAYFSVYLVTVHNRSRST